MTCCNPCNLSQGPPFDHELQTVLKGTIDGLTLTWPSYQNLRSNLAFSFVENRNQLLVAQRRLSIVKSQGKRDSWRREFQTIVAHTSHHWTHREGLRIVNAFQSFVDYLNFRYRLLFRSCCKIKSLDLYKIFLSGQLT